MLKIWLVSAGGETQLGAQRRDVVAGGHDRPVSAEQDAGEAEAAKIGGESIRAAGEMFLFVPEEPEIAAGRGIGVGECLGDFVFIETGLLQIVVSLKQKRIYRN